MEDMLMLISQAAEKFNIPQEVLRELVREGIVSSIVLRNTTRIRYKSMIKFLEEYDGKDLSDLDNITEVTQNKIVG